MKRTETLWTVIRPYLIIGGIAVLAIASLVYLHFDQNLKGLWNFAKTTPNLNPVWKR